MIEQSQFKSFADRIVSSIYSDQPHQKLYYKQEGAEWITSLYNGNELEEEEMEIALEMGPSIKEIVEVLSVVIGTYKMIKEGYTAFKSLNKQPANKKMNIDSIKEDWLHKLTDQKIDNATAQKIVNEFAFDLTQLVS